eukprot:jgi/Psemu1/47527/gm1.47527_g
MGAREEGDRHDGVFAGDIVCVFKCKKDATAAGTLAGGRTVTGFSALMTLGGAKGPQPRGCKCRAGFGRGGKYDGSMVSRFGQ